MDLTHNDYVKILNYYKINIPKSNRITKKKALNALSNKLCRCIKKFKNESKGIGICTKNVVNKKGFTLKKFRCKNRMIKITRKNNIKKFRPLKI
jgi:hypothetical protein